MPEGGFEPPCPKAYAPQTYVSANSTTPAITWVILIIHRKDLLSIKTDLERLITFSLCEAYQKIRTSAGRTLDNQRIKPLNDDSLLVF
jgi:hypothetical protein